MSEPAFSTTYPVDLREIRSHYDQLSSLYRRLWGEHLHHGYWENGETIAQAQIRLMERLAERAGVSHGASVLDIGCGIGGSALWLARQFDCRVTGFTISPVQAAMANREAKRRGVNRQVCVIVQDANQWEPEPQSVDLVWILESSEHFPDKKRFFERCAKALKPGGTLAVGAWLRRDGPLTAIEETLIASIARAMMSASLDRLSDYCRWMQESGLTVTVAEDITTRVSPTWTYCCGLTRRWWVRLFLRFSDEPTRRFTDAFPLMVEAYAKGAMAYGLFVAKKPAG